MQQTVTLFLFLLTSFCVSARKYDNPPNCSAIHEDFLFMANTEVSNIQYKEFLSHVKERQGVDVYNELLPDSLVWRSEHGYHEPYVEFYFNHPAYSDYPVVGISYEEANAYCLWLSETLNTTMCTNDKYPFQKVVVRLPTLKEWEMAARAGNVNAPYPWGTNETRRPDNDKKNAGDFRLNCLHLSQSHEPQGFPDNADVTAPVKSYWPNKFGLYNMAGNVAEIVAEQGIAKGGSWRQPAGDCRISSVLNYHGTDVRVGFRYVVEVVEFRPNKRKPLELDAKTIESAMVYIPKQMYSYGTMESTVSIASGGFWMATQETTNEWYQLFLADLKAEDEALFEKYKPQDELWQLESPWLHLQTYSWHPRFADHPVVNIPFEAANAFCRWLTEKYLSLEKRAFPDAYFVVPDEFDWELAARGGREMSPYPWGGPYLRNAKGCYLANFNPLEAQYLQEKDGGEYVYQYPDGDSTISRKKDGASLTAHVESYHPNDLGLFNVSGNVSEMVVTYTDPEVFKGSPSETLEITRGGSFADPAYYLQVSTRSYRDVERMKKEGLNALPTVGFRFMMIIPSPIVPK